MWGIIHNKYITFSQAANALVDGSERVLSKVKGLTDVAGVGLFIQGLIIVIPALLASSMNANRCGKTLWLLL